MADPATHWVDDQKDYDEILFFSPDAAVERRDANTEISRRRLDSITSQIPTKGPMSSPVPYAELLKQG